MLITYINYNLFCFLENNNSLDVKSDVNMFVLQFFFRARVIVHLIYLQRAGIVIKFRLQKKVNFVFNKNQPILSKDFKEKM